MKRTKIFFGAVLVVLCMLKFGLMDVKAVETTEDEINRFQEEKAYNLNMESIKNGKIIAEWDYQNHCWWEDNNGVRFVRVKGFELELSTDSEFSEEKRTTYFVDTYQDEKNEYTYKIPVSVLGSAGGKIYARIRVVGTVESINGDTSAEAVTSTKLKVGDTVYGQYQNGVCWDGCYSNQGGKQLSMKRDYFDFVKINKTNFPGLYLLLKNGYYECDKNGKKTYYDANKDGWLDPSEIAKIRSITNFRYKKYAKDQKYYRDSAEMSYQSEISSIKGLDHFPWVTSLDIRDYTSTTMDLTDYPYISEVSLQEFQTKSIKLVSPSAKKITIDSEVNGSWREATLKTIDVSKCVAVVDLSVSGSYYQKATVKLPTKAPNLIALKISYTKGDTLNLNRFTKLKMLEMYNISASSLKVGSCKQLQYVYFWADYNLRKVDLAKSTQLVGVDIYDCPLLATTSVKTVKGVKVTREKGKWWYGTKNFQKLFSEICNLIY